MTRKLMASLIAATVVTTSLVGCGGDDEGIDSGVVISRTSKRVTVLEDDGETDTHKSRTAARWCRVGDRWPDCKNR